MYIYIYTHALWEHSPDIQVIGSRRHARRTTYNQRTFIGCGDMHTFTPSKSIGIEGTPPLWRTKAKTTKIKKTKHGFCVCLLFFFVCFWFCCFFVVFCLCCFLLCLFVFLVFVFCFMFLCFVCFCFLFVFCWLFCCLFVFCVFCVFLLLFFCFLFFLCRRKHDVSLMS